jgi:hypothetical protein
MGKILRKMYQKPGPLGHTRVGDIDEVKRKGEEK